LLTLGLEFVLSQTGGPTTERGYLLLFLFTYLLSVIAISLFQFEKAKNCAVRAGLHYFFL